MKVSLHLSLSLSLSISKLILTTFVPQERAPDEQKEESKKLKAIIERHKTLIPKVQETLVKTECYWKCYSYGDDLIPIFEFIDDLRNRSSSKYIAVTEL